MTRILPALRRAGLAAAVFAFAFGAAAEAQDAGGPDRHGRHSGSEDAPAVPKGNQNGKNAGPCPNAFALHDASRVVEFRTPKVETFQNVAYTAEIQSVKTFCSYTGTKPIKADIELEIGFGRGPASTSDEH